MRQTGESVVYAMVGLVEEREGDESADGPIGDDAAGGTIDRVAGHSDVFDVFAPALQIAGEDGGRQVNPEEVFPEAEKGHGGKQDEPDKRHRGHLHPDTPPEVAIPNRRTTAKESAT